VNWFAVWTTASGGLVSVGTVVAVPLPNGLSTTDLGANPPAGVWNSVTHVFDAAAVLKPVLSLKDFANRFTTAEREALQGMLATGTQTQKNKLNAFRQYLNDASGADLNDAYIVASVNLMETAGVIAAGRAAVILA
jgi:hypothetical protein